MCVIIAKFNFFYFAFEKKKLKKTCCQTYEIAIWVIQTIDIDDD